MFRPDSYLWLNDLIGRWTGFQLKRAQPSFSVARRHLFEILNITKVYDCGSNDGQWINDFRQTVSKDVPVVCFEPIQEAIEKLVRSTRHDSSIQVQQFALSNFEGVADFFKATNAGMSSSLKHPMEHLAHYEHVKFAQVEQVRVAKLDAFLDPAQRHYLKIDVQGAEFDLLQGATRTLAVTHAIEIELSLSGRMYSGESGAGVLLEFLEKMGFKVFSLSDIARDNRGACLYVDALLIRS